MHEYSSCRITCSPAQSQISLPLVSSEALLLPPDLLAAAAAPVFLFAYSSLILSLETLSAGYPSSTFLSRLTARACACAGPNAVAGPPPLLLSAPSSLPPSWHSSLRSWSRRDRPRTGSRMMAS